MMSQKFCRLLPLLKRPVLSSFSAATPLRALSGVCSGTGRWPAAVSCCQPRKLQLDSAVSHGPLHPQGLPLYNTQSVRFYKRKKTIRIGPTKPMSFDYSGDIVTLLPPVNPAAPKPGFEGVEELKTANKDVKDIFSMAFADGRQVREKRLNELLVTIQEHPADIQSLEVQIARTTFLIRNQMRHILMYRKDKMGKSRLVKRIHQRNRNLRKLREVDMEKFEWLLGELKIRHVPVKSWREIRGLSKRAARKEAARNAYFAVKKEKLADLRSRLEKERVDFEKEKEMELTQISKELEAMGITEVDSVDSVLEAIGMDHYIEKPEKRMKRRYMILQKKFALHEEREKAKAQESQV